MSAGAAGLDLASAADEPIQIPPGGRVAVPTGLAFEIPPGFEGQVRPRSGLARKFGITPKQMTAEHHVVTVPAGD